ncbi:MAG: segregation and condensation protein A [Spirochaetota bacterium]
MDNSTEQIENETQQTNESHQTSKEGHQFKLDDFEGPLDLLLFLIKRSEVNIYDIPIAQITEQYLRFLEYSTRVDLDSITEFYVMASTLLYIKSRMLLPVDIDLDEELGDPREELVEKLIEYQKYKKLTELMQEKQEESEWAVERVQKQRTLDFLEQESLWEEMDVWDLLRAFSHMMSNLTPARILDLYEEVSINEKATLISELIDNQGSFKFTDLIVRPDSIMDIVCAFLAVLDMVKLRRIRILQNRMFGDIRIEGRDKADALSDFGLKEETEDEAEPEEQDDPADGGNGDTLGHGGASGET